MMAFRNGAAALGVFIAAFLPTVAQAEPSAEEVISMIDKGDQMALLILDGYANGMEWANTELESRGDALLFCAPRKLAITAEQNADILRQYIKTPPGSRVADLPAGIVLLNALRATFPCS